jgi:hypothetical protein
MLVNIYVFAFRFLLIWLVLSVVLVGGALALLAWHRPVQDGGAPRPGDME